MFLKVCSNIFKFFNSPDALFVYFLKFNLQMYPFFQNKLKYLLFFIGITGLILMESIPRYCINLMLLVVKLKISFLFRAADHLSAQVKTPF